jgi:Pentapeptide repeats (9 copies)
MLCSHPRFVMLVQIQHDPPGPWRSYIAGKPAWLRPYLWIEYPLAWVAYALSRWSFLHVLESLGSLSVLVAVIFYFSESGDRLKQKHYQAWQVINTAQHMGGSGGRIDALSELNADRVPLVGVDVSSAFLQGVQLPQARLLRSNFTDADVRNSNLTGADLSYASLNSANFRESNLSRVNFTSADLTNADFCGAHFGSSDLADATLDGADLGNSDLSGIQWQQIRSIRKANLADAKDLPEGFLAWALKHGAVQLASNPSCPVTNTNP